MTIDELKSAIEVKNAESAAIRTQIQANTDAARKLNDANRTLMSERNAVEKAKHKLEQELRHAEKEAAQEPTE